MMEMEAAFRVCFPTLSISFPVTEPVFWAFKDVRMNNEKESSNNLFINRNPRLTIEQYAGLYQYSDPKTVRGALGLK